MSGQCDLSSASMLDSAVSTSGMLCTYAPTEASRARARSPRPEVVASASGGPRPPTQSRPQPASRHPSSRRPAPLASSIPVVFGRDALWQRLCDAIARSVRLRAHRPSRNHAPSPASQRADVDSHLGSIPADGRSRSGQRCRLTNSGHSAAAMDTRICVARTDGVADGASTAETPSVRRASPLPVCLEAGTDDAKPR